LAHVSTGWMFLVPLNIVSLITGMFMDGTSAITRLSLRELVPGLIAFVLISITTLMIITYILQISIALPRLVYR